MMPIQTPLRGGISNSEMKLSLKELFDILIQQIFDRKFVISWRESHSCGGIYTTIDKHTSYSE